MPGHISRSTYRRGPDWPRPAGRHCGHCCQPRAAPPAETRSVAPERTRRPATRTKALVRPNGACIPPSHQRNCRSTDRARAHLLSRGTEALEHEFLDSFPVLNLGDVEIAFRVHVHVMQDVELARSYARPTERVERLERLAVEHPDPRRAARSDIQKPLLGVVGEGGAGDGLAVAAVGCLAIAIDEHLRHILAVEREHLHALAAAIRDVDQS